MNSPSPTVRRRELGSRLRALRLGAGMTVEEVAVELEVSPTKISRIETAAGGRSVSVADVRFLCDLYQVSGEDRSGLIALTRESRQRSWWQQYGLPESLTTYIGLEEAAETISEYESGTIPALLQTEGYARAVIEGSEPELDQDLVSARVNARLERQIRLQGARPTQLWAVLDEAALHRAVGGPDTMLDQLRAVTDRAQLPHVTIQVIPYEAGAHQGLNSSFILLHLADAVSDVVYVEGLLGSHYLQSPADLDRYRRVFDRLRAIALSPRDSLARIVAAEVPHTRST